MPLNIKLEEIFPISDFVRNASEHTARIRRTKRAEILTHHGRPSLAILPAEEFEKLIEAREYLDSLDAIRQGLQAAKSGDLRPADVVIAEWESL